MRKFAWVREMSGSPFLTKLSSPSTFSHVTVLRSRRQSADFPLTNARIPVVLSNQSSITGSGACMICFSCPSAFAQYSCPSSTHNRSPFGNQSKRWKISFPFALAIQCLFSSESNIYSASSDESSYCVDSLLVTNSTTHQRPSGDG